MEIVIFILAVAVVSLMVGQFGLREKHRQLNARLNGEVHGLRKSFKKSLDMNSDHFHGHINDLVEAIKTVDGGRVTACNDLFHKLKVIADEVGYELTFERKEGKSDMQRNNRTMGGPAKTAHPPLVLTKKAPKKAPARRRR